ncbi:hypothetical protein [Rhodoblastus sp.]|uniref:hypothetical protein n=1 Tax=Rhodoblastus sp. TaxID=1962975 RepID=UPI003F95CD2C
MSKNTVSASATGLPDASCRVEQLQREAAVLIKAHAIADRKKVSDRTASVILDMRMRVLSEKLDGIESAASFFPANSATGALFQLSLIHSMADVIQSWIPEDSERAEAGTEARQAISRMCYSIRDFIVAQTGANPEDGCGDYYMSESYNPHRLIEDAIAGRDAADE